MGGHIALIFTKENSSRVNGLILTGSSVYLKILWEILQEEEIKNILEKTQVFYNPEVATDELVDRVFEIANKRTSVLKLLGYAKSAIRHNMAKDITKIKQPTCLTGKMI